MKKLLLMLLLSPVAVIAATNSPAAPATIVSCFAASTAAPEEALQKFVGVYQLNEQFSITISAEGGKLYGLAPGDAEKTEFTPISGNKFRIKGPEAEAEFQEENGKVQYLFIHMQGGLKLQKVK
ncbi:DUF3471 domain-containing protein [Pontibacter chitinilyticus]|uniref:DUF3471 domain-containing protein n=1 Tax=Pontibacter chitinilyticus TaxID=2674989 RepID=UPI0032195E7F